MPSIRRSSRDSEFRVEFEDYDFSLNLTDTAKNYFSTSSKPNEFQILWVETKTFVYTGDLHHDVLDKRELLNLFPGLSPKACPMSSSELEKLENRTKASLMVQGVSRSTFDDLQDFFRYETPLQEIKWQDMYQK